MEFLRMKQNCAVFLILAALWGCSGAKPGEAGPVLRVGNGAEVQNLDPHLVTGVPEHRILSALFEGLVDVDPVSMEPAPAVAESWKARADGLGYTFRLREDARWSNGDPVTAHDFIYAWQRILSPNLAAEYAYMLHCLKNARAFNLGEVTDFAEVGAKALDDYTLEVTFEHPTPYFLGMQIHYTWHPVHRATIEQFGAMDERDTKWTRAGNLVGNGPFTLEAWHPNEVIRVVPNALYWNAKAVRLDAIEFYPIDNNQTEERSFRSGELHLTETVPLDRVKWYRDNKPAVLHIDPYCGVYYYRFNVTRPPFDDKRVRQAFAMALDREELTTYVMTAGEAPASFFTPPDTAGYTCETKVSFDPVRARALLAEAGFPKGEGLPPVEILYNTNEAHKRIAEAVQGMWKEHLNADVRLLNQDWKVYLASMNNLDYGVARSAWIADVLDPINFLECFLTGGGNNRTGFASPAYDALLRQSSAEVEREARYALLQRAEALLLDEMPIVPIYFYTRKYLRAPQLKGFVPNALGYIRWIDLYFEAPEA